MANILEILSKTSDKFDYADEEGKLFTDETLTKMLKKEYMEGFKEMTIDLSISFDDWKKNEIDERFTLISEFIKNSISFLKKEDEKLALIKESLIKNEDEKIIVDITNVKSNVSDTFPDKAQKKEKCSYEK